MFKRIKRTSLILGITLTVILGMSYGTFIFTTNSYRSTEMLISNLTYGIEITSTGGSETINGTTVSLTSGKTSTVLLKITSLNKIISKYGIDYKMSSGTGSVKYASNTGWLPTGKINENNVGTYEKVIKVVITATTDVTVDFTVTGGYSTNDLTEVKEGYTRLTEIYDGIVDYKEDLKTIISKETTNNIYGGEAINNYLQYPTNTDTTKNIWRVLGYYNSVDGIKVVSNQASTTTESNISSSLTSFYNTLEKQEDYVLETNKFNCTNTTCTTSNYSNIGLLSTSEYNMLGGVNSYLASNESYFGLDNTTIKNITSSGITDTTTSTTSGLRPAVYLQNDVKVTGSGTSSDPYRLSDKGDVIFASATLNGTALETFPKESDPYIPKTVTCTNGSIGQWNTEKQKIELTTVNLPTSCVVDFTEGYTVTLNATNGTVTAPVSKTIGRSGTATFTVTPNDGYKAELETNTCGGTLSGNTYTISNITSNKTCSIAFKKNGTSLATLIQTNAVNENGYRYEGSDPNNYITMEKTDGTKETWRIIGLFPDGANGEDVIRVRKAEYEEVIYDDGENNVAYIYKNTVENKNNLLAYTDSILNKNYLAAPVDVCSNCVNYWPKTALYSSWSEIHNITNYKNTVNYKIYLGTTSEYKVITVSGWYEAERGTTAGATAKSSYSSATTFTGSVGLIYPSDYGYGVLASDCERTITPYNYNGTASCYNKNWLYQGNSAAQWLISPGVTSAHDTFQIQSNGITFLNSILESDNFSNGVTSGLASPVMALSSDVLVSGSGTKTDPYVMQ
mgnify:CR=1 FL=1